MVKLSKKTKSSNTDKALRQIVKLQADAHGMSVSEFKKKRDTILQSQKEYEKTHWVSNLTDAQKYFIATSETPQHYMGKPLSKSNLIAIEHYKLNSKGYAQHVAARNAAKKLRQGIEKTFEPFKKLQQEYQEIGKRLKSTFEPERRVAEKLTMGLGTFYNPFDLSGMGRSGRGGLLDVKPVDKSHGLNTLMKKHKMKSALEIPEHFLKVYKDKSKSDYYVENYGNVIALANACGLTPFKVFELICFEVRKRKKHYQGQAMIATGIACEELVNEFNDRIKKNDKYAMTTFFSTKFRQNWSLRHGYDWSDYRRFHEEFPNWLRIFNARAKKYGTREEAMEDLAIEMEIERKKGK